MSFVLIFASIPADKVKAVETGSPVRDTSKPVTLTIHKYLMKNMSNAGKEADGEIKDKSEIPEGAVPLKDIKFDIYKVADGSKDTKVPTGTPDKIVTTGDDGIAVATDLPQGRYLVVEEDDSRVESKCAPFLVNLPMTDKTGTKWIYDVHVYPKNATNDTPVVHKFVTEENNMHDTARIGDKVTWIIEPTFTKTISDYSEFNITDKIDTQLDYVKDSLKEIIVVPASKNVDSFKLDAATDYKVTEPSNDRTLKIDITQAGREALKKCAGGKLKITFETEINKSAVLGKEIPNQAILHYTNEFKENNEPKSEKPEVHTGGTRLIKVDATDKTKTLKGAEFKIFANEEDAKAALHTTKNEKVLATVVTDDNGIAEFTGLKYGKKGDDNNKASTTYYVVETKAPDGYNLYGQVIPVTINKTSYYADPTAVTLEKTKATQVTDMPKTILPLTGGMGTIIFTAAGIVLITAAAALYVKSNKKQTSR